MKRKDFSLPHQAKPHVASLNDLRQAFIASSHDIKFVGGCVRDWILGKDPKDIDLHTDATPEVALAIYAALGVDYYTTGLQHGTITIRVNDVTYEVTSLRRDVVTDGRHAQVEYTADWEADLARRDLTINAMSMSFEGKLHDPFDGWSDLHNNHIRFVGEPYDRIREDYLRILRFFRFMGRYGVVEGQGVIVDTHTAYCIRHLSPGLQKISVERVWMELGAILAHDNAAYVIRSMYDHGVMVWLGMPDGNVGSMSLVMPHSRDRIVRMATLLYERMKRGKQAQTFVDGLPLSNPERALFEYLNAHTLSAYTLTDLQELVFVQEHKRDHVLALAQMSRVSAETIEAFSAWDGGYLPVNGNDVRPFTKVPTDFKKFLAHLRYKHWQSGFTWTKADCMTELAQMSRFNT